ncbi:Fructose-2,6-bisphosphatase [Pseudomonas sp. URIL14HWK12:I9]|uniref:histidine phosphatase family protein n=1 Tax=Pseudomonas sp. URIL14HWK12:I11 TaxID=1261626 RepID=UPI000BCADF83|nr:histidine phosphatase family protein [Pseudomonas sp. URIL14HWK12:I11]PVZ19502.1 histidine phosphatase superfamily protein (branch 1) [Pseudomonas sp. URIL14HWK12:I12]PVZ22913.1 histidine phosphatase superfamily protein (branch 1) [Pseudomonas sp. URIL14HWK12:I10]PVZ37457.1 histidine phosphatase superfamily protein (branch 1) [Pseudomonas sp. URIL14HWK12:I11]SNZ14841.1 Fructose-2,6-bisphosphatase [Pseudomonas sp. URIL14HWK12:I9]
MLGVYHVCQALREVDPGRWRGQALSQLARTEPEALARWLSDPAFKGHGGKSVIESVARLAGWMNALEPGTYSAVTHPGVIRAALLHALGAEAQRFNRLDIAPLSCVRLSRRGHWKLLLAG